MTFEEIEYKVSAARDRLKQELPPDSEVLVVVGVSTPDSPWKWRVMVEFDGAKEPLLQMLSDARETVDGLVE